MENGSNIRIPMTEKTIKISKKISKELKAIRKWDKNLKTRKRANKNRTKIGKMRHFILFNFDYFLPDFDIPHIANPHCYIQTSELVSIPFGLLSSPSLTITCSCCNNRFIPPKKNAKSKPSGSFTKELSATKNGFITLFRSCQIVCLMP